MKEILLYVSGLVIAMMNAQESSCTKKSSAAEIVIPLAVGNEWIYQDSVVENGVLTSVMNDTDRITGTSSFEGKTTFIFSDGKEMMLKGDTLLQLVRQRSNVKFPTPFFIATETESKFNYVFGGDVVKLTTVNKLNACSKNSLGSSRCYRMRDTCGGEIIFGYGVGVLREKKTSCSSPERNFTVRNLISVKFVN